MPEWSQKEDGIDRVCSFCGKQATDTQGMISCKPGTGIVCGECLEVIAELQWEEVVETAAKARSQDSSLPASRLMKPQLITRVSDDVHPMTWTDFGVNWICDGCGSRLRLDSSSQPPREHSYEIVMGNWLDMRVEKIPERKFVTLCNSRWRRLL